MTLPPFAVGHVQLGRDPVGALPAVWNRNGTSTGSNGSENWSDARVPQPEVSRPGQVHPGANQKERVPEAVGYAAAAERPFPESRKRTYRSFKAGEIWNLEFV